ncbi:TIGR02530 family flagellar biosynthesis protein [Bacillus solimangrovi]|uniref:Flagellar protein n=1 Tax=Bacillus solimangrovi TaxID=1305675 RepID=A0A1E5LAZ8_9BACI|nr:TIGR02530 family flagellar biosynthesis protein [Bacillus solimangrovi]OEH91266.1 flagellar protein [Bacillus solimangrovi]
MDHRIHHIQQTLPNALLKPKVKPAQQSNVSFKEQFNKSLEQTEQIKVSKHATQRLQERKIEIQDQLWNEISSKVQEAKHKGVKDALVLTNNSALIVSAKNNVVITAMNRQEAASQIFTNINGTIILDS